MDNQTNTQEPINQTPINQEPPVTQEPIPQNEYQPVLDQYAANTQSQQPPVIETPVETAPPVNNFTPISPKNNFFKTIFIVTIIIFVLVSAVLAFVFIKNKNVATVDTTKNTPVPTVQTGNCPLNDKNYKVGESFLSTDGCNTCTCISQDNIACTEKACLGTSSAAKK